MSRDLFSDVKKKRERETLEHWSEKTRSLEKRLNKGENRLGGFRITGNRGRGFCHKRYFCHEL